MRKELRITFCLWFLAVFFFAACGPKISDDPAILSRLPEKVDYNYHIRPLLSDRCYSCHGPDEKKREAGLRLDIESEAKKSLSESEGYAIVEGSLRRSKIIHRIHSADPEEIMPPAESNLLLDAYEKALIAKWISQGAEWKPHWAFIPPQKPSVPKVRQKKWVRNPIDHFVLKRLENEGISPSPEADKEQLLRRVTLDLTGLPPTIGEIDDFLADDSPEAYEKVVDRLLQTDAYAERMTMEWLDVARYADSHGLHADGYRFMWPWRDWVIRAFRENMPFDRFVTWQLAGDLLPDATKEQRLATAFHRNHPMTAEGGVVDEEWRLEYVFDRATTTSRAFLGLTLECARCHDHKFDPLSQKEFYQLSAFFNNVKELGMTGDDGNYGPSLMLPDEKTEKQLADIESKIAAAETSLNLTEKKVREIGDYLNQQDPVKKPVPDFSYPLEKITKGKSPYADNNSLASISGEPDLVEGKKGKALRFDNEYDLLHLEKAGVFEMTEPYSAGAWIFPEEKGKNMTVMGTTGSKNNFWRGWELTLDTAGHLETKLIHSLPHNYLHLRSEEIIPLNTWTHVMFTYDGRGNKDGLNLYINGKPANQTAVFDHLYKSIKPVFSSSHLPEDRAVRVAKSHRSFGGDNGIYTGRIDEIQIFRKTLTPLEVALLADNSHPPDKEDLLKHYLFYKDSTWQTQHEELIRLKTNQLALRDSVDEVMVMEEMPQPRAMFVLDRGVYDAPQEEVSPNVPNELGGFPSDLPPNRLGLAQWLLNPRHPMTARVTVNRYWQMYFGQGIVATPEDFGSQGTLPTHPELLDWLAVTFVESGWDVRAMQKLIVMSATYRQSSKNRADLQEKDPYNLLLARGARYRLSAEMIRDNALAASGLLVQKIGGASVKPYQPEGLWIEKSNFSYILLDYKQDKGEDLYRRGMYTFIRRTSPHPSMTAFDASDRNNCVVRRQNTNTPMQALILLNDPQYVEAARFLGERMMKEGGAKKEDKITYGFRLVTGRKPEAQEVAIFLRLYEDELKKYTQDQKSAQLLLKTGEKPREETLPLPESAAMAIVASMMFNHDAFYTKR
ncbi:MAG: DUF1553 domain-containing protein [Bacteroidia bacterium]|nr:DUF1553 domain-containing protein [Bacteroidia bacterium]